MELPPLTTKAIKTYVEALPADVPCGEPGNAHQCLLARYIRSHFDPKTDVTVDQVDIHVWRYAVVTGVERMIRRTPPNVRRLVSRFDRLTTAEPLPADVLPIFNKSWKP